MPDETKAVVSPPSPSPVSAAKPSTETTDTTVTVTSADGRVTHTGPKVEEPGKGNLASYAKNDARMQPGFCETDETTGLRVIHPAANPQQVNPIHDSEHESAATAEAKVLVDKGATAKEKIEATAKSNEAEGAPSAIATKAQEQAVKDDADLRKKVEGREEARKKSAEAASAKASSPPEPVPAKIS